MKKWALLSLLFLLVLSGCGSSATNTSEKEYKRIGILLSDTGLGDNSFNDSAFRGLEKARDELDILFTYEEAPDGNFEDAINRLVEQDNDLIIGLGFTVQEAIEQAASKNPKQPFVLIDSFSEVENVTSITFKEHEGSFLVGMIAALVSDSETFGFIGGIDAPVVHKFELGFTEGIQYVSPKAKVLVDYANDFGDASLGTSIAQAQIDDGAKFIYPAAGYTGVGAIKAAQTNEVYAAGVDTDQFFVAEKAVVTSMIKNIDVAVFDLAKQLVEEGKIPAESYELGLKDGGVSLATMRLKELDTTEQAMYDEAVEKIISGELVVSSTK